MKARVRHYSVALFCLTLSAMIACAPKEVANVDSAPGQVSTQSGCHSNPDQAGSYLAKLGNDRPSRVYIDPSFEPAQHDSIVRALNEWNVLGEKSLGKSFFQIVNTSSDSALEEPQQKDDCSFGTGSGEGFGIVREDSVESWQNLGLGKSNPAATIRCQEKDKLTRQVILINTKYINQVQFMSIVLHEFGHAIGLDHSCLPGSGRTDFAGCSTLSASHPYRKAVLYPTLKLSTASSDQPEVREQLRDNDRERAHCLYEGL